MKPKYYIPIIILIVVLISVYFYLQKPVSTYTSCNWEPGLCKNICTSQNYYFDSDSKECKKYVEPGVNKGCCTPPPFETLEECKLACE